MAKFFRCYWMASLSDRRENAAPLLASLLPLGKGVNPSRLGASAAAELAQRAARHDPGIRRYCDATGRIAIGILAVRCTGTPPTAPRHQRQLPLLHLYPRSTEQTTRNPRLL